MTKSTTWTLGISRSGVVYGGSHNASSSWIRRCISAHAWMRAILFVLGLALGIICLAIPPLWTIAALLGLSVTVCLLKWPEFLPLAFLVITSTIVRMDQAPSLPIGFGTLYLTDILFLFFAGYLVTSALIKPGFTIVRTPLDWPLLTFWILCLFSTLVSVVTSSLPWKQTLHETRIVTGYLLFFVVTILVRNTQQLIRLAKGILVLATVVALSTIGQQVSTHLRFMFAGRIETFDGVARIIPPGQALITVGFVALVAACVMDKVSPKRLVQSGLLALAMAITFFRAAWLATALNILIIGSLAKGYARKRLLVCCLLLVLAAPVLLAVFLEQPDSHGARLVEAATERISTVFEAKEFKSRYSSLRWRDFEYRFALPQIFSHPLLGLGLGARYRPLTSKDHGEFDGREFIHNGHVYVVLKSGIFAYVALLLFLGFALLRGLRYWRHVPHTFIKAMVLGFALTFITMLIVSNVEPYLMEYPWTPVIGIIAGFNEVVFRQFCTSNGGVPF